MKRTFLLIFAGCVSLSLLAGCGNGNLSTSSVLESSMVQEATPSPEATATPEPTVTPEPTPKSINIAPYSSLSARKVTGEDGTINYNVRIPEDFDDSQFFSVYADVPLTEFLDVFPIEALDPTADSTVNIHFVSEFLMKKYSFVFADGSLRSKGQSVISEDDVTELLVEPTPTPEPTPSIDWHGKGMYKVGTDLEPGIYFFKSTEKISGYYAVTTDSSGDLSAIVDNDNVDNFSFLLLEDGQYIKVERGKIALADQIEAIGSSNGKYIAGTYRVGIDIPAGEYNIQAENSKKGYYAVLSDLSGGVYSIVSNDNFDSNAYVTVSDGQYLKFNRAYIESE